MQILTAAKLYILTTFNSSLNVQQVIYKAYKQSCQMVSFKFGYKNNCT